MTAYRVGALAGLASAGVAGAQYSSDFEGLTASAAGELLTGQDAFYIPVAESTDFRAYTYMDNVLGIPQNPGGGDQFVAGEGGTSPAFARAQRDITWPTGSVE